MTLYDAAFAALARLGGHRARRPIAQITLLGGLASTTFWPIGHVLALHLGWRAALVAYAGFALLTVPLHLAIPNGRHEPSGASATAARVGLAAFGRHRLGGLYALIVALTSFLNSAMSAHMIGLLTGLGLAASVSVWVASLRGVGQSSARLCEVLSGGHSIAAAMVFAFLYGAGNGIATITRGTLPLVLFDHRTYGPSSAGSSCRASFWPAWHR